VRKAYAFILFAILTIFGCNLPGGGEVESRDISGENSVYLNLRNDGEYIGIFPYDNDQVVVLWKVLELNEGSGIKGSRFMAEYLSTSGNLVRKIILDSDLQMNDISNSNLNANSGDSINALFSGNSVYLYRSNSLDVFYDGESVYEEIFSDRILSVNHASKGFYVLTENTGYGKGTGISVLKYGSNYNRLWQRNLLNVDRPHLDFVYNKSLFVEPDMLLIYGSTGNELYGGELFLVKLSGVGGVHFEVIYGRSGNDQAQNIFAVSDGGFLLSGKSNSLENGITENSFIKTDKYGIIEWELYLSENKFSDVDSANRNEKTFTKTQMVVDITEAYDGYIVLLRDDKEFSLLRIDLKGRLVRSKRIAESYCIVRLLNNQTGLFILSGYLGATTKSLMFTETNSNFNLYTAHMRFFDRTFKSSFVQTYNESYKIVEAFVKNGSFRK